MLTNIIVLFVAIVILQGLNMFLTGYASSQTSWQYDVIYGALFVVTAATSIMATLIIAYRIYYMSCNSTSRKNYWYIVEIMVQSVSVYSALMAAQAICIFAAPGTSFNANTKLYFVSGFLNALGLISSVSENHDI